MSESKAKYEAMSYRELQSLAKGLKIPASLKKHYLIELILAQKNKDERLFRSVVETALAERNSTRSTKPNIKVYQNNSPVHIDNLNNIDTYKPSRSFSVEHRSTLHPLTTQAVTLAPRDPFVLLNASNIPGTRETRSKHALKKYPIVQCTSFNTSQIKMADSTKRANYKISSMSCARTKMIPEISIPEPCTSSKPVRKNATVLEALLQAPMSSRLDQIAADCMRGEQEPIRTVKVVGDSEAKKPPASVQSSYLHNSPPDDIMNDMRDSNDIIDLRVSSDVHDIHWQTPHVEKIEDEHMPNSIEDHFLQNNLNQGYSFHDFGPSSSDHDHQYPLSDSLDIDKKITMPSCSRDSGVVDNFMDALSSGNDTRLGHPLKDDFNGRSFSQRELDKLNYNINYTSDAHDESNIYVEVGDYSAGQGDGNNTDDFYNDSGVQELDNYYDLTKNDGHMTPRTYNSILNEYLNLPDISVQGNEGLSGVDSSQTQESIINHVHTQNDYLNSASHAISQESSILQQELLQTGMIQDNVGNNDYPVAPIEGSGIGESEYDPLTTALTLNFQSYGSLGLSPPSAQEHHNQEINELEVSRRVDELLRVCRRHSQWEVKQLPLPASTTATALLCFLCNWVGRVASFEDHLKRKHSGRILKTARGMLTLEVNIEALASGMYPTRQQVIMEHREMLYVLRFKFKPPDTICAIILAVPPRGQITMEEPIPVIVYIQATDPVTGEEITWHGCVECLNQPGRPSNLETFASRASGRFQVALRDIHVISPEIGDNAINLAGVNLPIDVYIQTLHDVVELETSQVANHQTNSFHN